MIGPKRIEDIQWMPRELAPVATDRELLNLARGVLSTEERHAVLVAVASCRETFERYLQWSAAVPECNPRKIEQEILQLHQQEEE